MQLGELIEKMTTSDRLVIINAAGQVIYRGYAANFAHGTINPLRRVKRFGLDMETYKRTEKKSRVPAHDIHNYAAGSRNKVYGWEITAVKEYPQAVALEELGMKRAPQSWQYVR